MRKKRMIFTLLVCGCMIVGSITLSATVGKQEITQKIAKSASADALPKQVKKLKFVNACKQLKAGKTKQFRVNKKGVIWKTNNPRIALVTRNGKVKALRIGKTTISATVKKETVKVVLRVIPKKVIGIDPGHQQRANNGLEPNGPGASVRKAKVTGGTRGVSSGKTESAVMLEIALKLRDALEDKGYGVVMTRTKQNVDISNAKRAKLLNKKCDIALRLHADGINNSSVNGASMQCSTASNPYIGGLYRECKKLSESILQKYCQSTQRRNRGISYRDDLTGTNFSTIPVTLIELGFMTNVAEDQYLTSEDGQKEIVKGLVAGIDKYFKK
ncbi:N-acetylmuramoyl-L-alanine amidase [Lachnospiraceae bacterium XBB1006]|nr:N-acetylmuramoyl-L-alanine amidase [Lachnospiraceae bacterium XBB1006]